MCRPTEQKLLTLNSKCSLIEREKRVGSRSTLSQTRKKRRPLPGHLNTERTNHRKCSLIDPPTTKTNTTRIGSPLSTELTPPNKKSPITIGSVPRPKIKIKTPGILTNPIARRKRGGRDIRGITVLGKGRVETIARFTNKMPFNLRILTKMTQTIKSSTKSKSQPKMPILNKLIRRIPLQRMEITHLKGNKNAQ